MTAKHWALLVGGLIPAFLLGFSGLCQKLANQHAIGAGPFLIVTGLATCLVGLVYSGVEKDLSIDWPSAGYTILFGLLWGGATGLIAFSLRKLGGSLSQIVPLYNMNTLVAVIGGLILLAEWRTVSPPRILLATALIMAGGLLAAKS